VSNIVLFFFLIERVSSSLRNNCGNSLFLGLKRNIRNIVRKDQFSAAAAV